MDRPPREYPLNADPFIQMRLLELQDKDTRLGQLAHKGRTLPDAVRLAEADARLARLRDEVVAAETIAGDLEHDQAKADLDVEQVRERARRDQQLLDSGSIGDPKQLQSLQSELQNLARRQGELEDVELEIMERVEGARAAVAQLTAQRDATSSERDAIAADVANQMGVIESERVNVTADRVDIAQTLPADLLALYDKIRADHGGVGAAPLHRGRCEGCRLELPPNEIEALRAAPVDAVIRCEECRRILVRTPESGLH
jgi:predicted  nucleic acid-binding Zn-ribbon protein